VYRCDVAEGSRRDSCNAPKVIRAYGARLAPAEDLTSAFGNLLRNRRAELRLGLRDFALPADMDAGNLSKIERGRLNAPQDRSVLDRICLALEWDLGSGEAQRARDVAALENGRAE
jgi:hypothetical protein